MQFGRAAKTSDSLCFVFGVDDKIDPDNDPESRGSIMATGQRRGDTISGWWFRASNPPRAQGTFRMELVETGPALEARDFPYCALFWRYYREANARVQHNNRRNRRAH